MNTEQYISSNALIMHGKPVITGTRITVESILEKLSAGESIEDVLIAHPHLTKTDVFAALAFAGENL